MYSKADANHTKPRQGSLTYFGTSCNISGNSRGPHGRGRLAILQGKYINVRCDPHTSRHPKAGNTLIARELNRKGEGSCGRYSY
jgi:hypothetical protein